MKGLIVILASLLIRQISGNINEMTLVFERDPAQAEKLVELSEQGNNYLVYLLELYFKTPVTQDEVSHILQMQNRDGSFSDIDYSDQSLSQCSQTLHAIRFQRLAVYNRLNPGNKAVKRALHKALKFWAAKMPKTNSWYYNQVNIPKAFGPGFLLFADEMSRRERRAASAIMRQAQLTRNGQNLVWEAGNLLIAGLLEKDEAMVKEMAQIIQDQISPEQSAAGIQPDWSFMQHGTQLQFGNYGLSFAVSQAYWARAFEGTSLALQGEKREILESYICKGIGRTVWNGFMDQNALGRQIFPRSQQSKTMCLRYALKDLGLDESAIENGPRYYPYADFGNYRADGWYASLRMQSSRTIGYEEINGENQKGYFSADGVLLLRRSGDEFSDIAPVWNWRHLPGTTTCDDDTPLWGTHTRLPYNKSDRVFGVVAGDIMVVAMEYDRDSVFARKVWAFCPEGVLCMGSGISSFRDSRIITTVDQVRREGEIEKTHGIITHNGTSYIPLGGSAFSFAGVVEGRGSWRVAAPYFSDEEICGDIFEVYIDHGIHPRNGGYSYFMAPGKSGKESATYVAGNIDIISDTSARIDGVEFTVNWDNCEIKIGEEMAYESNYFIRGSQAPVDIVKPGLQRQILGYNNDLMLVKVTFGPEMVGQRPPLHRHHQSQSSYIVSGKFEFHRGDREVVVLGPGDAFYVEPDVPHEAYCLEPGIIIDSFNPVREDFLCKK